MRPLVPDARRAGDTTCRGVGRGGDRRVEASRAEPLGEVGPEADRARNGHGRRAVRGRATSAERRRRTARAVDPSERTVPDDRERIAAQAVVTRLADREHRRRRERGVDGVAAALERRRPARVARGWLVATIASRATAGIRRHPLDSARPGWKSA